MLNISKKETYYKINLYTHFTVDKRFLTTFRILNANNLVSCPRIFSLSRCTQFTGSFLPR